MRDWLVYGEEMWKAEAIKASSISLLDCGTRILSSCSKIQKRAFSRSLHGENSRKLLIARYIRKFENPFEEFLNLRQRGVY